MVGTPQYMAPEQLFGEAVDGRADLYATGAVLFECVTGRPVFEAPSLVALLARHLDEHAAGSSTFNPDVPEALVRRDPAGARSRQPEDRWQSALDLLRALETVCKRRSHAPAPASSAETPDLLPLPHPAISRPVQRLDRWPIACPPGGASPPYSSHSDPASEPPQCADIARTLMVLLCSCPAASALPAARADAVPAASWPTLDGWYRRTAERTPGGQWGISIGTMDGPVLWSVSPDLELIPASTAKVFTTGFSRTRMGGGARFTTRVIGDGRLDYGERPLGRAPGRSSWAATRRWIARAAPVPRCVSWLGSSASAASGCSTARSPSPAGPVRPLRAIPTVWSPDYEGQLYAPPVGPVALHENTISLTFRPGPRGRLASRSW